MPQEAALFSVFFVEVSYEIHQQIHLVHGAGPAASDVKTRDYNDTVGQV